MCYTVDGTWCYIYLQLVLIVQYISVIGAIYSSLVVLINRYFGNVMFYAVLVWASHIDDEIINAYLC